MEKALRMQGVLVAGACATNVEANALVCQRARACIHMHVRGLTSERVCSAIAGGRMPGLRARAAQ